LFSLILLSLFGASAVAGQRVIVIMKDRQTFQAANMAYRSKGAFALRSLGARSKMAHVDGHVEASLEHLNTLIVNAKDESEVVKLQQDPAVAYVEKKFSTQHLAQFLVGCLSLLIALIKHKSLD